MSNFQLSVVGVLAAAVVISAWMFRYERTHGPDNSIVK
jgi:hypothetical protein